jgi:hypothetical protein
MVLVQLFEGAHVTAKLCPKFLCSISISNSWNMSPLIVYFGRGVGAEGISEC